MRKTIVLSTAIFFVLMISSNAFADLNLATGYSYWNSINYKVSCPKAIKAGASLSVQLTPWIDRSDCVQYPTNAGCGTEVVVALEGNPNGGTASGTPSSSRTMWGPFRRTVAQFCVSWPGCGENPTDSFGNTVQVLVIKSVPASLKNTAAWVNIDIVGNKDSFRQGANSPNNGWSIPGCYVRVDP
jgi:hypothetical protein